MSDQQAERRQGVLQLLRAAAAQAPTPEAARDWLHTANPLLCGVAPSAAARISVAGAEVAHCALRNVRERAH